MTAYTARRLPVQPGPAGWNRLLPEPAPPRRLETDRTADVAVIGAGFAGLSAARRLGQIDPGLSVAVLEAGRIGEGPAGRNSGFMIDLPHDLASDNYAGTGAEADQRQTFLNRRAIRFAAEAAEELGLGAHVFDPCGKVNAAATPAGDRHNAAYAEHLAGLNEPHRRLDADAMAAMTGTGFYTSGVFTPGTVMLQPAAYIRALGQGVAAAGADVFEDSPVTRIARAGKGSGGGWRLETPGGAVTAARVILATNGHAESFGFFAGRLIHVFTYATITEPLPAGALGGEAKWGVTPADPMGTTVRRIEGPEGEPGGGRIVVRSRFTCNPGMTVGDGALARARRLHVRRFDERFPMLRGVGMAESWAGHLCLSWNGMPAHGEIDDGIFSAVCQNGLGTVKGTLAGISAAELACGVDSDTSRSLAAMPGPRRLPPEPLAAIGINATLRWKEWRAGRE
jgi:glycine/D-amino acid oxidase-like deaminating enzyme